MTTKQKGKKIDNAKVVEKIACELLKMTGAKAKIDVFEDKDNNAVVVNITSDDETGLLIGKHGDTISSIQAILGIMTKREIGEWVRIVVNVGDWIEKQESRLQDLALQAAARAKETKEAQQLYNLTAGERRVIHLCLSKDPDIETESSGEGRERFLIVSPKKQP